MPRRFWTFCSIEIGVKFYIWASLWHIKRFGGGSIGLYKNFLENHKQKGLKTRSINNINEI